MDPQAFQEKMADLDFQGYQEHRDQVVRMDCPEHLGQKENQP